MNKTAVIILAITLAFLIGLGIGFWYPSELTPVGSQPTWSSDATWD